MHTQSTFAAIIAVALSCTGAAAAELSEIPNPPGADHAAYLFKDGAVTCVVVKGYRAGGIDCQGAVGNLGALKPATFTYKPSFLEEIKVVRQVIAGRLCYRLDAFEGGGVSCL
jgi:hypothetical protein